MTQFMSKHVAHAVKFTLLFHENGTMFRIWHIKIGKDVTISTELTGVVVTLELQTAQELNW